MLIILIIIIKQYLALFSYRKPPFSSSLGETAISSYSQCLITFFKVKVGLRERNSKLAGLNGYLIISLFFIF